MAPPRDPLTQVIHRILCIHLGTPPSSFDWAFEDKDKKHTRFAGLTPLRFLHEHVQVLTALDSCPLPRVTRPQYSRSSG